VEAIDRVNVEVIEPLKREVEDFRQSDDYLKIQQCLYNHKVDPTVLKTSTFPVGNFTVDVLPVDFSYSPSSDEVYAKMGSEASRGLEILKREIEKKQREYALSAVSDLVKRILDLAEALTEPRKRVRSATEKVDKLMEICESLGLNKVNEKVLRPLKKVCRVRHYQRPKLAEELFGEKSLREGVDKELKRTLSNYPSWGK
jgi:ribosomal protein L30/L7E